MGGPWRDGRSIKGGAFAFHSRAPCIEGALPAVTLGKGGAFAFHSHAPCIEGALPAVASYKGDAFAFHSRAPSSRARYRAC